jgi:hypothetical protein
MKMTVFWGVVLCSVVEIGRCFRGAYCLHHQRSVSLCEATQHNIPGDIHLNVLCHFMVIFHSLMTCKGLSLRL